MFEQYLIPADSKKVRCIDERNASDPTNGVQFPGGVYGFVDAIKSILEVSEDEAWQMVADASIPVGAHVDEHHHELGCGYAKKVEQEPASVGAPESTSAKSRMQRVEDLKGDVLHYQGEHKPTHATINYRSGTSMNPAKANEDGLGIFNYDAWAAHELFSRLDVSPETKKALEDDLANKFAKTVETLAGIKTIHKIQ